MFQRARAGAFLSAILMLTVIFATFAATAAAEEDAFDCSGMSFGFGGIYVESNGDDIYYDWCGPLNTLRAGTDEHLAGLVPQYNVDQTAWVPFVDAVTFTIAGEHRSLHTVGERWVDADGNAVPAAGEGRHYIVLDTTGPATRALSAVTVRRYHTATFQFRVRDRGSRMDIVRIVVKKNGKSVATYRVGRTEIKRLATYNTRIGLPKGRYRWFVMAVDRTGNAQVSVGRNTLVVR